MKSNNNEVTPLLRIVLTKDGDGFTATAVDDNRNVIKLAHAEFMIVNYLYNNRHLVIDKSVLEKIGWDRPISARSLPVAVTNLRRLLKDIIGPIECIATKTGIGYQWTAPENIILIINDLTRESNDLVGVEIGKGSLFNKSLNFTMLIGVLVAISLLLALLYYINENENDLYTVEINDKNVFMTLDPVLADLILPKFNDGVHKVAKESWDGIDAKYKFDKINFFILNKKDDSYILDCLIGGRVTSHISRNLEIDFSLKGFMEVCNND